MKTPRRPPEPACCAGLREALDPALFKALSEPNRLRILAFFGAARGSLNVSGVCPCCSLDLSVVSRHLKTLCGAGVLDTEKVGKEVYYRLRARHLADALRNIADALERCCPQGANQAPGKLAATKPSVKPLGRKPDGKRRSSR